MARGGVFGIGFWLLVPLASGAATLTVNPSRTVMGWGGDGKISVLYDSNPNDGVPAAWVDPSLVTWASENASKVTLTGDGNYQAKFAGLGSTVTVSATYQGLTAATQVYVSGRVLNNLSLYSAPNQRYYKLFVPSSYHAGTPRPLILSFHGGGGTSNLQMDMSQWIPLAEREAVLVAFPDGTGAIQTWNAGGCCGSAVTNHVDDVGFVRDLVQAIQQSYSVDSGRIYATGMSNGAILSHRLACEMGDVFKAIAPVSGGLNFNTTDFTACTPAGPVSVMAFHGTTDKNYPYAGGMGDGSAGVPFSSIPWTMDLWKNILDVNEETGGPHFSSVTFHGGIETCTISSNYRDNVKVGLCLAAPSEDISLGGVQYDGGGHAWPSGMQVREASDFPTFDVSANETMWSFFKSLDNPDSSAPSVPGNLAGVGEWRQMALSWDPSRDVGESGLKGYRIDVSTEAGFGSLLFGWNGRFVGSVFVSTTVSGLNDLTTYYARVRAEDYAGNLSVYSPAISVETPDSGTPGAPTSLTAAGAVESILLTWTAPAETGGGALLGYHVDVSETSDFSSFVTGWENANVGGATQATVTGLNGNARYFARVRAVNVSLKVSAPSATAYAATVGKNEKHFLRGPGDLVVFENAERIKVVDRRGNRVIELKGQGSVVWDGKDADGRSVESGYYVVEIRDPSGALRYSSVIMVK